MVISWGKSCPFGVPLSLFYFMPSSGWGWGNLAVILVRMCGPKNRDPFI